MKYARLFILFVCTVSLVGTSIGQKLSIKDKTQSNNTILVIKDEKASDTDILNQQFDLDSFSMNEEVRITRSAEKAPETPAASVERVVEKKSKNDYVKVYGAVPPPRTSKVKMKKRKIKYKKKRKKYRGFCFSF